MQLKSRSFQLWTGIVLLLIGVCGKVGFDKVFIPFADKDFVYQAGSAQLAGEAFSGMSYAFHENGQLYKIQFFLDGKQVGVEHRWYGSGEKWVESEFKNGKPHGQMRMWYPNGQVKFLKHYNMGKAHGEFWGWHPNGVVSDYHVFDGDRQSIYRSYIADGKPFYNFVYTEEGRQGLQGGSFCKTERLANY